MGGSFKRDERERWKTERAREWECVCVLVDFQIKQEQLGMILQKMVIYSLLIIPLQSDQSTLPF